jgi:Ion channel
MPNKTPPVKQATEKLSHDDSWFDRPSIALVFAAIGSLLLCVFVPEIFARKNALEKHLPDWFVIFLILLFCSAVIIPFGISLYAILACLRSNVTRFKRLVRVSASYLANIIIFTGLYYCFALVGDRADAVAKFYHYEKWDREKKEFVEKYSIPERPQIRTQRAFNGIQDRLFTGVDWLADDSVPFWAEVPLPFMLKRAKMDFDEVVVFVPESRAGVLLDCLHFSIVTSATVGYGDISPNTWYTKLTADFQIVQSVVLVVLVLGMLFGGWWEPKEMGNGKK